MNVLALPAALAFTMNLTLCLIVLSDRPKSIAHRLFTCFVLEHLREEREGGLEEIDHLIEEGWVVVVPFFLRGNLLGFILYGNGRGIFLSWFHISLRNIGRK